MLDLVVSVSETLTVYVLSAISRTFMQTTEVSVNGFLQGEVQVQLAHNSVNKQMNVMHIFCKIIRYTYDKDCHTIDFTVRGVAFVI